MMMMMILFFCSYPVSLSEDEGRPLLHVGFEELMCEVLGEEGEHEIGALRIRHKLPPCQQLLSQHLDVREHFLSCDRRTTGIRHRSEMWKPAT